jgi:hypothetical protein
MVSSNRERELGEVFRRLAEELDVPDAKYQAAVDDYRAVGHWLVDPPSALAGTADDVYVQGSFRIGTAVRPVSERDEYDVDLVAPLLLRRESATKDDLKERIGKRLKEESSYRACIEERRRCWTLHLGDGFHVDVLPAVPCENGGDGSSRIWIGDTEQRPWLTSDPIGFAHWFVRRAGRHYDESRAALAMEARADVSTVPAWRVKAPLQRVVQLLKRHRDVHFQSPGVHDLRPISVVVTTLAARAYGEEGDLWEAFRRTVAALDGFAPLVDGKFRIPNPVNEEENFADRWNEDPRLARAFFEWTKKLRGDVDALLGVVGTDVLGSLLGGSFGPGPAKRAIAGRGSDVRRAREQGALRVVGGTLVVGGTAGHVVPPHTFYGEA